MSGPRGRIVFSGRSIDIGGVTVNGPFPAIIVYLRASSGRAMRRFHRYCQQHGLHPVLVQAPDAWEVIGHPEGLNGLLEHEAVREWHFLLDVKPPRGGQGSGPLTPTVEKAIRHHNRPKVERLAIDETQRRAKLPVSEQQSIELADASRRGLDMDAGLANLDAVMAVQNYHASEPVQRILAVLPRLDTIRRTVRKATQRFTGRLPVAA
jgi:hypothetical protein